MSDPFIGQILMFGGNFAPRGFVFADGQLMSISQNTALFSLFGTTYGGDGRTTFGIPNLQGRFAMHPGHGPSLTDRRLGEHGGSATETLTSEQMAPHNHAWQATNAPIASAAPADNYVAVRRSNDFSNSGTVSMHEKATAENVGGKAHENVHSHQVVSFIVAVVGTYPPRA